MANRIVTNCYLTRETFLHSVKHYRDSKGSHVVCSRLVGKLLGSTPEKIRLEFQDEAFDGALQVDLKWYKEFWIDEYIVYLPDGNTLEGNVVFSALENLTKTWGCPKVVYLSITAID